MNNYDIARSFVKKVDIENIINDFYNRYEMDKVSYDPKVAISISDRYKKQIYLKFKIIFQRQIILDQKEAKEYYNANINVLNEQIDLLYFIIDQVNTLMGITYIPDKLTVCSFLRINAETFDFMQTDATIEPEVQEIFNNLNEFLLSLTQMGLESGSLNRYAWERLQLKNKYGGHGIEKKVNTESQTTLIVSTDIQRKLSSDYDFSKMIESNNTNTKQEG